MNLDFFQYFAHADLTYSSLQRFVYHKRCHFTTNNSDRMVIDMTSAFCY